MGYSDGMCDLNCCDTCHLNLLSTLQDGGSLQNVLTVVSVRSIHVISPDFGGSSQFGAIPPDPAVGKGNLPTKDFSHNIFSTTDHLSVYVSNLPGELFIQRFTARVLTFMDII